jgi:2'-5' RNA ligase
MSEQNRYFVAIIPTDDVPDAITAFRNDFKETYNSGAALKNIPHITLKAPFTTAAFNHDVVINWFNNLSVAKQPFTVTLNNFGVFDNPKNPVIYVHPLLNEPMVKLQKVVIESFKNTFPDITLHFHEHAFDPHITIAYRDLAYAEFTKAWQVYRAKQYSARFEVTRFYLLQHDSKEWKVIAEHDLT